MNIEIMVFERQILSLALIEKELYQLYTNLSEKVEDVAVKTLFSYIATDSLKHSNILVTIIEEVDGSKAQEQDCDADIIYNKIPNNNIEDFKPFIYSIGRYRIKDYKFIDTTKDGINYKDLDIYDNRIIIRQINHNMDFK